MALGVSWLGWRRPIVLHEQQRWGYIGRTSEQRRDVVVGRVTFEVQGDENWVCGGLGCAKGLRRSRCDCCGGPTSHNGSFSPLNQPTTRHQFAWPASVTRNMPRLGTQTPQIEFQFSILLC